VHDTGHIPAAIVVVRDDGAEIVVGRIDAGRPDLVLVDALARLQLAARRCGWSLHVRDAPEELRAYLELLGLAGAVAVETRRQPELREQLRVEEVVKPGDPPL
jgi:hypothetical protein